MSISRIDVGASRSEARDLGRVAARGRREQATIRRDFRGARWHLSLCWFDFRRRREAGAESDGQEPGLRCGMIVCHAITIASAPAARLGGTTDCGRAINAYRGEEVELAQSDRF